MRRRPVKNRRKDHKRFNYTANRTRGYNIPRTTISRGGFRF